MRVAPHNVGNNMNGKTFTKRKKNLPAVSHASMAVAICWVKYVCEPTVNDNETVLTMTSKLNNIKSLVYDVSKY